MFFLFYKILHFCIKQFNVQVSFAGSPLHPIWLLLSDPRDGGPGGPGTPGGPRYPVAPVLPQPVAPVAPVWPSLPLWQLMLITIKAK